ncbi:MAG: ABC transporter ATP-binding protein, partial [Burkholderiaceae bacterium]
MNAPQLVGTEPMQAAGRDPAAVVVSGASVVYPGDVSVHALENIDLRIAQGEFVSLIGPSGC